MYELETYGKKTHLNLRTSHFSSRKSLIKMKNEGVFWRSTVHASVFMVIMKSFRISKGQKQPFADVLQNRGS